MVSIDYFQELCKSYANDVLCCVTRQVLNNTLPPFPEYAIVLFYLVSLDLYTFWMLFTGLLQICCWQHWDLAYQVLLLYALLVSCVSDFLARLSTLEWLSSLMNDGSDFFSCCSF